MKYILDFDRTVFDMDRLYACITKNNPLVALGTVASLENIDLTRFIFPDALAFLVTQQQNDICIVSSCYGTSAVWDMAYQTEKIKRSGIAQYVNKVFVVPESKVAVIKRLSQDTVATVFVDDHPEHVQAVASALPEVHTFYLDRSNSAPIPLGGIPMIKSLTELPLAI